MKGLAGNVPRASSRGQMLITHRSQKESDVYTPMHWGSKPKGTGDSAP